MYRFWNAVIQPLLTALDPKVLVEVGCARGRNTTRLLEFAKSRGATLHVIDPVSPQILEELRQLGGCHLVYHQRTSLEALPDIDRVDVYLIDGDHNWYTVYHELQRIKAVVGDCAASMSPILFHDVCWPYGRRDMYYDPQTIPSRYRQEHARRGLKPGSTKLKNDGLNMDLYNAVQEGGPRNGVRTAIDDFVAENPDSLEYFEIEALNGLGILWSPTYCSEQVEFNRQIAVLREARPLLALLKSMETQRTEQQYRLQSRVRKLKSKIADLKDRATRNE